MLTTVKKTTAVKKETINIRKQRVRRCKAYKPRSAHNITPKLKTCINLWTNHVTTSILVGTVCQHTPNSNTQSPILYPRNGPFRQDNIKAVFTLLMLPWACFSSPRNPIPCYHELLSFFHLSNTCSIWKVTYNTILLKLTRWAGGLGYSSGCKNQQVIFKYEPTSNLFGNPYDKFPF